MKPKVKKIYIFCLLLWSGTVHAIIGYDCGTNHLNITTLSLLEVGECDIPEPQVQVEKIYVQLLQLSDFTLTKIIQCKVEVDRKIEYCGMHSHTSAVITDTENTSKKCLEVNVAKCMKLEYF